MNKKELEAFAKEAAKGIKTPDDLTEFSQMLKKITIEAALNAEMDEHLGYEKHQPFKSNNNCNGKSSKRVKTEDGEFELDSPRDRLGSFDPKLVKKHQSRFTSMDDKILWLYAQGMSTRDIVNAFDEWYGAEISPSLVSRVTNAVIEEIVEWQSRPLDAIYPIVYLDCIVVKIRQDKRILNKSIFLALGINTDGQKELMSMWIAENEEAKFWLSVLTELNQRGVEDILIACVDGLKGFPDAINTVLPQTHIQLCIVHMVRNSLKYVSWKDYKAVTADLKRVYRSAIEEEALLELDRFGEAWDSQYPQISKSWRNHWQNFNTLFNYLEDIRRAIYTTNAIESLNSVIRKALKKRKLFANDEAATKMVYLAIKYASKKWSRPIQNWRQAMSRFIIEFEERLEKHVN
ncbi:IS256 family transposase [Vibrio lentus]|uniref:Mutator family transposase n=1 Tax=Vibrio lentus TaxID=136468 RepID=A0AB36XKR0_9VIBR|nr:IS256 family transposase [Vibrio lentus]MCC4840087.1 IS256 family transposase [Vibrio lentus]PMI15284.1 transposase [Vibrio lentus]PMK37601.1 transposase [Vibrio lentus]PMK45121.1 transposase [Vibrio lentus]PML30652.1 transposase [Vibrio lentus]